LSGLLAPSTSAVRRSTASIHSWIFCCPTSWKAKRRSIRANYANRRLPLSNGCHVNLLDLYGGDTWTLGLNAEYTRQSSWYRPSVSLNAEDLADCATDDLDGWSESKDGKTIRHAGILDRFKMSREDCEAIIINARIKAGWIK
jgi:hypothetical protein